MRRLLPVLVQMAARSLASHRAKSLIVGTIMAFGALLWTVGMSLVGSVDQAMSSTITGSVAGHLQVYEADTRDDLELYGGGTMGAPDIGEVPRFEDLRAALADVDGLRAVVPMGTTVGLLGNDSELDRALAELREAAYAGTLTAAGPTAARARFLIGEVAREMAERSADATEVERVAQAKRDLAYAQAATFWSAFAADPLPHLEFLDTQIAPLGAEGTLIYLRVLGTDLDLYRDTFEQLRMKRGSYVPRGKRGILFSEGFYDQIKHRVARQLDRMADERDDGKTFAANPELADRRDRNVRQYRRLLREIHPDEQAAVVAALQRELKTDTAELERLLQDFLRVDDDNFDRRYALFYDMIAPRIRLHPVEVGDVITVRAFTRSGYMRAANLTLYGTFEFRGMEESDLASVYNLVDLVTFRELYGASTQAQLDELAAIRADVAVADVGRDDAEAALFGGGESLVVEEDSREVDTASLLADIDRERSDALDPEALKRGLILHAAIVLDDGVDLAAAQARVQAAVDAAGLNLRVVDWRSAAGFVGQMTTAMRAVLAIGMAIILLVALVVINNTVLISTLERTGEIGTLRAMGAGRAFVVAMFLLETATIGLAGGLAGAALGAAAIAIAGVTGIPAFAHEVNFLFGGPRLYPTVSIGDAVLAVAVTVLISVVATLLPARHAARVPPVVALAERE